MESVLLELLCRLEALGDEYGELYDSDVRQAMSAAVFAGFIRALPGYTLPDRFAMYRPGGDQRVREVLAWFIAPLQTPQNGTGWSPSTSGWQRSRTAKCERPPR